MNIIYLISAIILYFVILFSKNTNKTTNFVITSIYLILILYFGNILLISLLSLIKITGSFLLLTIINIFIILTILVKNYKTNNHKIKFQKYNYNFKEIFFALVIVGICFTIGILRFDNFKSISYETTDPSVHYKIALSFSENMSLLTKENSYDELYTNFNHNMPGFSLNCGLLIKALSFVPSYIIYMLYDILVLCLIALTFYITCLKIKEIKNNNFAIFLVTCLYFCGYVLNDLIFGFGYLGIGIMATNLIILTWLFLEKENNKQLQKKLYILLFLFNYSLFFSYYLFMPVLYLAQGLYIIYKYIKKEYNLKQMLKIGVTTLIIPFIIGVIYFILPGYISDTGIKTSSAIAMEGYIYRDLWSNFILIAPLVIFSIIKDFKNKKISILTFCFLIELVYIIITLYLGLKGYVSSYYYYKSYYIFWLFNYIYIIKLINISDKDCKLIFKIGIYYITAIVLICLSNIETKIQNKNVLFNNNIVSPSYANVYKFNATKISEENSILNNEELELVSNVIKYKSDCLNNKEIPVIGNLLQKLWFYSITDIVPIYNHTYGEISRMYEDNFDYQSWSTDENSKCLIIFNSSNDKNSENYIDIDYNIYNILYKNNGGIIIKK